MYEKLSSINETFYLNNTPPTAENFVSIAGSLNCPLRKPTQKDKCFCLEPVKNSPFKKCQQYKNVQNKCIETVCCSSCDINKSC